MSTGDYVWLTINAVTLVCVTVWVVRESTGKV